MTIEEIIEQIRSKHPEISREEIAERLEKKKHKTSGLISEDTLVRMIAADLGMGSQSEASATPALSVVDLVPGLSNVTIAGRVVAVLAPRTFEKNRKGKVASLFIADKGAVVRVVMWNDRTRLVESESLRVGQILRIAHAYTKEGRRGGVELHVGEKCTLEIDPSDLNSRMYPTIRKFATKINRIAMEPRNRKVNIIGQVHRIYSASTFERDDSTSGKVMRFTVADETGDITVVVWNEKVDEVQPKLKQGARLQIVNASVKKTIEKKPEVHVDSETYVGPFLPDEDFSKISDLKDGLARVNLEGEVVTRPVLRNVETYKHEVVKLASFEVRDDTGRIWVSAWRKHAEAAGNLKVGDKILLKNAQVRKGFGDQLELCTREVTSLTVAG
jgi:ssDNA-binding replication factor A large subunit